MDYWMGGRRRGGWLRRVGGVGGFVVVVGVRV